MYCTFTYRIPYSETDAMGVVHHSYHPRYFERGRVEFLRLIEINYANLSTAGTHFPVIALACDYKRSLRFDDILLIETNIASVTKTRLNFTYTLYTTNKEKPATLQKTAANEKQIIATGTTEHCATDASGHPMKMALELFQQLDRAKI